eukprot:m.33467 g.33467  ORF g.33467 m.33467 type:complete len:484 (+) comp6449_c0_seq4:219-1670(+)
MQSVVRKTIFALSSGAARAGVAVIRVSGPEAHASIQHLTDRKPPPPRLASLRKLYEPRIHQQQTRNLLDEALVLRFDKDHSFTGEDAAEFQVHGGNAVVRSVMHALEKVDGLRHAEPGEFTRRAFWNGRLDLTQAEGLSQLIMADTEEQRKLAVSHVGGSSSKLCMLWRSSLTSTVAKLEAYIDFSEDENIEEGVLQEVEQGIDRLVGEISEQLKASVSGERISQGLKTAITGLPDVGKSTLLNLLCDREAAIVSSGPGTTRDVLQINADIGGFPVILYDTAGIRHGDDVGEVEKEGVRRAYAAASGADLRLCVHDGTTPSVWCSDVAINVLGSGSDTKRPCTCATYQGGRTIKVVNKVDVIDSATLASWSATSHDGAIQFVSLQTNYNMDALLERVSSEVRLLCTEGLQSSGGDILVTKERHRSHLASCLEHLELAKNILDHDVVLCAQNMRYALEDIGKITGVVHFEDILDEVFSQFCIGK